MSEFLQGYISGSLEGLKESVILLRSFIDYDHIIRYFIYEDSADWNTYLFGLEIDINECLYNPTLEGALDISKKAAYAANKIGKILNRDPLGCYQNQILAERTADMIKRQTHQLNQVIWKRTGIKNN